METSPLKALQVHDWQVEINDAGFIATRSFEPSVLVRELGKWSVTYVFVIIGSWARLISLALIWWQRLCVPAQWHKVWNPLTHSTFKPGFSPSVCRGIVEPGFQNTFISSPKLCFIISPGCSFSSGNIRISATAVEVFTVVTKIWSNIMVLLMENKKKNHSSHWWEVGIKENSWQGFYGVKKARLVFLRL